MKTFEGIEYDNFRAAATARGLFEDDQELKRTMDEAKMERSQSRIKAIFSLILAYGEPNDTLSLRNSYKDCMGEGFVSKIKNMNGKNFQIDTNEIDIIVLSEIKNHINQMPGVDFNQLNLPNINSSHINLYETILNDSKNTDLTIYLEIINSKIESLNYEQLSSYNSIIDFIVNNKNKLFFFDAPGCTGKTFLTNLILEKFDLEKRVFLSVASSGIASTL